MFHISKSSDSHGSQSLQSICLTSITFQLNNTLVRGLLCEKADVCDAWKQEHCPSQLSASLTQRGIHSASFGAASISDAHEFFEKHYVSINAAAQVAHLSDGDSLMRRSNMTADASGTVDEAVTGKCNV